TFVLRMQEDTGQAPGQVAKAYGIAREVFDARELWAQVEALDGKVHGNAQIDALLRVWGLMRHLTRWLLNDPSSKLDMAQAVERYGDGMKELRSIIGEVMAEGDRATAKADAENWVKAGFPESLAE